MTIAPTFNTKPSLTIKKRIKAPAARIYRAFTDPSHIAGWFGPTGAEIVLVEADARVGGRYRFVMRTSDGEEHDVSGVYKEVVPDERLTFTWAWKSTPERQSLVTVFLKPDGDSTMLTLQHEQFFDEAARDRHHTGWSGAIEKLERFVTA